MLESNPIFSELPNDVRERLERASTFRRYEARETILTEGDPSRYVFALLSGSVRVYHSSSSGLEVVVKIFKPPSVFGEMEAIVGLPLLEHVAALEASELMLVPRADFLTLIAERPTVAVALLRDLSARFCIASQNEKALAFHPVRARLAHFLVSYARFDGEPTPRGVRLRLRVTQDDMADALGVTRRAIADEVIRWQRLGVVAKERGHYVVRDIAFLTGEAEAIQLALTYRIGLELRQESLPG